MADAIASLRRAAAALATQTQLLAAAAGGAEGASASSAAASGVGGVAQPLLDSLFLAPPSQTRGALSQRQHPLGPLAALFCLNPFSASTAGCGGPAVR